MGIPLLSSNAIVFDPLDAILVFGRHSPLGVHSVSFCFPYIGAGHMTKGWARALGLPHLLLSGCVGHTLSVWWCVRSEGEWKGHGERTL